jgi:hypothetical protein
MSLINQYQTFKADHKGFADISFSNFRSTAMVLKKHRNAWSAADMKIAEELDAAGASFALFQLCGKKHKACMSYFNSEAPQQATITKSALDAEMAAFVKNCTQTGWDRNMFYSYIAYLDSGDNVPHIIGEDVDEPTIEPLGDDEFANTYRGSHVTYKNVVKFHLNSALSILKS